MSAQTNTSLPVNLDVLFGLKVPTAVSACTTNSTTSVTVTGGVTNIPAAGYVSGPGIPAGATYTLSGTTVTLSSAATASASGVNLTFSIIPTTLYFAIFTATPNAAGGGTEVSGGSYARVPVTNNTTNFPATSAQNKTNGTAINFPSSTAAWGTIVAWGIYDAPTGGNLWFYGPITSVTLNNGDTMNWPIGFFDLTF